MRRLPAIVPQAVAPEVRGRLQIHLDLLTRWNARINLVSPREVPNLWRRHVEDSLQLLPLIPADLNGAALDLGSGAGFPGLVLAIASGRHFHLIESDARKAAFLREAARETSAPATIHNVRIEAAQLLPSPLITARALAPLDTLLEWAAPKLTSDGICLFPKGRTAEHELTVAARRWHMHVERTASVTDSAATILMISEVRRVGPHLRA
jgi:16S rRNA (guanine527-N7)-methyltransferase